MSLSTWPGGQSNERVSTDTLITIYGVVAVTFMMTMYALERRHPAVILAFAAGCLASAAYGFLSGAWPFGVGEAIGSVIAVRRYLAARPADLPRAVLRGSGRLTDAGAYAVRQRGQAGHAGP